MWIGRGLQKAETVLQKADGWWRDHVCQVFSMLYVIIINGDINISDFYGIIVLNWDLNSIIKYEIVMSLFCFQSEINTL